jgi:hypothetical protein
VLGAAAARALLLRRQPDSKTKKENRPAAGSLRLARACSALSRLTREFQKIVIDWFAAAIDREGLPTNQALANAAP